MDNGRPMTKIT